MLLSGDGVPAGYRGVRHKGRATRVDQVSVIHRAKRVCPVVVTYVVGVNMRTLKNLKLKMMSEKKHGQTTRRKRKRVDG